MIVSLLQWRHRYGSKRRWRYRPAIVASYVVIRLPVVFKFSDVPEMLTTQQRASLYFQQGAIAPSLGLKIELTYQALVLLVGQEDADRQVQEIINEYLKEKLVA